MEIDFPARWAWHDHSVASRRAHGAAYATYVGSWRTRFRITVGSTQIDLTHEYQMAMDELGFTPADIKSSILASVEHCWLDEATRRQWLRDWPAEIDAILAPMVSP